jgi:hypothetical protein
VSQVVSINPTSTWQRFTHTASPTSTAIRLAVVFSNNTDEFEIWGAQLEAGAYATSYIPTTTASVTRVADAASKTGISSLIGQTEGTLFVDFEFEGYDNFSKWITFIRNTANTDYIGFYDNASSILGVEIFVSPNVQFSSFTFPLVVGVRYKAAVAYKLNDFAFYINGVQIATDNSGSVPTTNDFMLQFNTNNDNLTARTYNQALLFKTRLTNAQLAELTAL